MARGRCLEKAAINNEDEESVSVKGIYSMILKYMKTSYGLYMDIALKSNYVVQNISMVYLPVDYDKEKIKLSL